ncbi:TetR family transcriptional regulator [Pseudomonas sp. MAP12]|uniref:TetR family transcriptional regulator n=1 Tax=Geopseudomonas aromaticivorans TaxID=2849492 RepID=A0ABS6MRB3_9GAMM|nr:TetR/AcrR family transcriptional regulator [Pseudomonas aromaticivorans]MBV2131347.1 TetR family transcriptional regulator [Pseudomonas aromaticivorans]
MVESATVERILDAAQQLFAEKGFTETSLRLITAKAGVNLAAVNYHFGSKDALIQAVFVRFLGPFCQRLEDELESREGKPATLEELLELLVALALEVSQGSSNLRVFMRLLGMAVREHQRHLRSYLAGLYGKVFRRYLQLLQDALPGVPPLELFWRVHFMLGAATFSMAGIEGLREVVARDFDVDASAEQVLSLLVPFMAAGMRADSALTDPALIAARPRRNGKANNHGK